MYLAKEFYPDYFMSRVYLFIGYKVHNGLEGIFKRVYFWPQGRVHSKMCLPVQKVLYKLYNCPEDRAQRIHLFRDSWPEHIPDQRILRVYIYQAIVSSSEYVPVQMFMYRVNTFLEYCVQIINLTGGSSVEYKPV
jgi:hypothetical protein